MSDTRTRTKTNASARPGRSSGGGGGRGGGRDRFEAKRREDARLTGRRRYRIILGLASVMALVVVVIGFVNSTLFDVNRIDVVGADRADPADIVAASGIVEGQSLLDVDLGAAVSGIEVVPWVGSVTVDRAWTGEILVTVDERPPTAALATDGGGFALVDEHGRQLEIVAARPAGFIPVRGVEVSGVAGEAVPEAAIPVLTVLGALPLRLVDQVEAIEVDPGHLYLDLVVGGRVDFGDGSDLAPKIQAMETLLDRVDLRCLDTMDVRVPAAPVVTRTPAPSSGGGETTQSEPGQEPDSDLVGC